MDQYPESGQKFFDDFSAKYGDDTPDPYAIYGFEAMSLILDTCKQLGADCADRQKMIDALFATKARESVLGTYDIDENGDTTLTDYGVYSIKDGTLTFSAVRKFMDNEIPIDYSLKIDGDTLKGKGEADFGGQKQEFEIEGKREKKDK